jgi:hypothetical protein
MYRTLPQSEGKVLGYECSGTITEPEVKEIHREIESVLEEQGNLRFLIHIADLDFPEAKAVWEDLKLTPTYVKDVERFAIVGDAGWQEWATKVTDLITKGEARFFEASQLDEAWDWVLED